MSARNNNKLRDIQENLDTIRIMRSISKPSVKPEVKVRKSVVVAPLTQNLGEILQAALKAVK
jgi:hypothetical protein